MNSVLTVRCKLKPTVSQIESFERTIELFTTACNYALKVAREHNEFNRFRLHALVYRDLRSLGLPANLAITAIERVGKRKGKQTGGFKRGSVSHNSRTLKCWPDKEIISLSTVDKRVKLPISIGQYQRHLLSSASSIQGGQLIKGKSGKWYAHIQVRITNKTPKPPTGGTLGVDLGIANIATTSDGEIFSGAIVETKRQNYSRHRSSLQKCGSRSAKRRLKKVSGREARFRSDTNHVIAKSIVENAKGSERGIKLEDLTGIAQRTRVKRKDRAKHMGWSFYQLRSFIEYRCVRDGVPLATVDPRNTSRKCSECGHCEKANRRSQGEFVCKSCGYSALADYNAAVNIARADIMQPIVSWVEANPVHAVPQKQAA